MIERGAGVNNGKEIRMCGTVQWYTLGVLALELSGLNLKSFQGLKFVW